MISRDPDKIPELPQETIDAAEKLGKKIVHIICEPPKAKVGDIGGISFFAILDFLPRIGETVETQNKKYCKVVDVVYRVMPVTKAGKHHAFSLMPNVVAIQKSTK